MAKTIYLCMVVMGLLEIVFGQPLYNPSTEICCDHGRIFPRNETTSCCGPVSYNMLEFACCSELLFPLPVKGDTRFSCCSWQSKSIKSDKPYHPISQICCNGNIQDLPLVKEPDSTYSCCNDNFYDKKTHSCCNGKIFKPEPGEQCCSGKIYNSSKEACCGPFDPEGQGLQVVEFKGSKKACCGVDVFDIDKESCCGTVGGSIIKGRPRGWPSRTSPVECCNGVPFYTDRKGCCGRKTYSLRNNVCCGGQVLRKPRGVQGGNAELCCGEQVINDPETELCHKGEIVPVPNRRYKSCGDDIIATGPKADYDCCWNIHRKYRKKDQICCNRVVVTITSADMLAGRTSCCAR